MNAASRSVVVGSVNAVTTIVVPRDRDEVTCLASLLADALSTRPVDGSEGIVKLRPLYDAIIDYRLRRDCFLEAAARGADVE